MLDFGCGLGFFMDEARAAGWTVAGVDLSAYARDYAQERFGLSVEGRLADVHAPPGGFDVVCVFQVLEHTSRPDEILEDLVSMANPKSTFIVETWDRNSWVARIAGPRWHQIAPPAVTHLFDRGTLSAMLRRCELEPSWVGRTSKRVSIRHVSHTARSRFPRGLEPVIAVASRWIGEDRTLRYSLGDLITIVAQPASPG
jgi:SAM-dependent methyltransferase